MIPSSREVAEIGRKRDGSLAEVPFAVLLRALAESQRTAVVRLARGPLEKNIVFDAGVPVECESNLLHESLGRVLVGQGKLAEVDYQRALTQAASEDRSLAEVLVGLELVSSYDLFRVMQQSLAHKLLDVFAWRDGTFRVLGDPPDVESPLRVNVGQLVITGVLRFAPQAQVDAAIGTLVGKVLGVHPEPPLSLPSLRLGTRHSKALQVLRGRLRLDEVMGQVGLAPDEVTRLVYALAVLGIVAPVDELPAETAGTRDRATASAAAPASAPSAPDVAHSVAHSAPHSAAQSAAPEASAAEDTSLRDALMALYMRHRRGDAFDLLQVPTNADPAQLAAAYLKSAQSVAPWRFATPALSAVADKAEELFLSLARAYAEIADGESRARLLERRRRAAAGPYKKRSDVYAIKTDLLDAAAQFSEGRALKEAGHYAKALSLLEFATDCDAQNAEYLAEAAHCRFLDAPQSQARAALDRLAAALRIDPGCALAALYAGQIHLAVGDIGQARASLQAAAKLRPNDARIRQALRDLGT